jgi:hypothetical protein
MELMLEMEEFIKRTLNKLTYGKRSNVRTYTYAQLDCKCDSMFKDKNTVSRGALEYMQQYNGGTIKQCIFMAIDIYEDCVGEGEYIKVIDHG